MNRKQAGHILDAYVHMRMRESDKDASDALREVVLDAMTGYKAESSYPKITYPYATLLDATKPPTNWDGTPRVTCTSVDPASGVNTAAVEERDGR